MSAANMGSGQNTKAMAANSGKGGAKGKPYERPIPGGNPAKAAPKKPKPAAEKKTNSDS